MGARFTENAIEILDDWNAVLSGGCCCQMPECPIPAKECESKTAYASCEEGSEGQEFDEQYAQWEIDYQAWVDNGMVGDEPVQPVIPDGVSYGCWVQWVRPDGEDEDKIPLVYRKSTFTTNPDPRAYTINGEWGYKARGKPIYIGFIDGVYVYRQTSATTVATYVNVIDWVGSPAYTSVEVTSDFNGDTGAPLPGTCNTSTPPNFTPGSMGPGSLVEEGEWSCDATVITKTGDLYNLTFGTPQSPDTCPAPTGYWPTADSPWEWANLDYKDSGLTLTLGDSTTESALFAAAAAELAAETWVSGTCFSSASSNWPTIGEYDWTKTCEQLYLDPDWRKFPPNFVAQLKAARFRWVVPDTFEGSYFKVTWDILEEPDGWDDPSPTVFRSFVATDQTWEWTGPGDPEDPDSWKSGWYEIDPPSVPGTRRVVNIRFECYRSTHFGNKPQVTGEAVELPDP